MIRLLPYTSARKREVLDTRWDKIDHDPKVTMRYAHLWPQAMLEAVNVVGNVVGRRPAVVTNQVQTATMA